MAARTVPRPSHSSFANGNSGMAEIAPMVATDLTALPALSHAELKSRWTETFVTAPPKGLSRRLLICALAYQAQAKDHDRLKPATRKQLVEIATSDNPESASEAPPLTPGTRLMREWRGTVHVVDVTEDGLVWNGRAYASLSAIARTITGTRWSGNRFFGLRKRSDAAGLLKCTPTTVTNRDSPQSGESENFREVSMSNTPLCASLDRAP